MAEPIKKVERIGLDGTGVTVTIGKTQILAVKASFGDKLDTATLTEMGTQEISERSEGVYSTEEVKITFTAVRYHSEFSPRLQADGFGSARLPIVISESHPDLGSTSDQLGGCRYVGSGREYTNENGVNVIETTWTTDQVYWGNERKTRNKRNPNVALQPTGF